MSLVKKYTDFPLILQVSEFCEYMQFKGNISDIQSYDLLLYL